MQEHLAPERVRVSEDYDPGWVPSKEALKARKNKRRVAKMSRRTNRKR